MDDFQGIGGSYVVNPKTGKKELVERTQDPSFPVSDQPAKAAEQPTDAKGA